MKPKADNKRSESVGSSLPESTPRLKPSGKTRQMEGRQSPNDFSLSNLFSSFLKNQLIEMTTIKKKNPYNEKNSKSSWENANQT